MPPPDDLGNRKRVASGSGKSAAELERDLQNAQRQIKNHNAERCIFIILLLIIWDKSLFVGFESWAPVISILVLQLVGFFIVVVRFEMHEVITLFWALIRSYGRQNPGDPPG